MNRPLEDWGKLIGVPPGATAILDRFLHDAEVIAITGRSGRLQARTGKHGQSDRSAKKAASEGPDKQKSSCQKSQE